MVAYVSIALSFVVVSLAEYTRGNIACAQIYILLALQTLMVPFWRVFSVVREIYSNPIGALVCSCSFVYFLYQVLMFQTQNVFVCPQIWLGCE